MAGIVGQVAIVTGGAGLIGAAISRRLAAEGAAVIINGRDGEKAGTLAAELREQGYAATVAIADVRDAAAMEQIVARTVAQHGRLDIIVNNAGGVGNTGGKPAHIEAMTPENWQAVIDLNLTAAFNLTRAAIPQLRSQRYGRIVNISSAGYFGIAGLASYAAAKAGLIAFTKTTALELADVGVTANAVVPHLVESPRGANRPPAVTEKLLAPVPIKRFGTPDEIAGAVYYFASPEAGYITGEALHVMGGLEWLGVSIDMTRLV